MRYQLPQPVERLVNALSRLPSIGPRSARRLAYYILKSPEAEVLDLADALKQVREKIKYCRVCASVTDKPVCAICSSDDRDHSTVCVIENPQDVTAIEVSGYNGLYHVLMGSLSPLDGIGPEDLRIDQLIERVRKGGLKEIILALDPNVEGEATAAYLKERLKGFPVKVTQLAYGIPMGGNLEYADGVTLGKALEGRREL